ncbi:MAG: dephospho-CoA kinase [Gammaproteobacteria bacterium]|nr:dephospho-CoA kinase [Gammaproteobacteria bacterium]
MLIIGLTGGIGSGKSTVADLFRQRNIPVIDTDEIARELVKPGQPALKEIVKLFGSEIINNQGELNRQLLAQLTFNNNQARKNLEAILHPRIFKCMNDQIQHLTSPYVITVIPLLIETGELNQVNHILLVDCPEEIQIQRVRQRDQRDEQQIKEIINAQATRKERLLAANDIIENQGDIASLDAKIEKFHQKFLNMSQDQP